MEDTLDEVAVGKRDPVAVLKKFYKPLEKILEEQFKDKSYIDIQQETNEICELCGKKMALRYSKYGKFFACTGYPDCKGKKSYVESIEQPCPKCGGKILVRMTKTKRRFYGCSNYPTCDYAAWNVNQIEKDTKENIDKIAE
ncbi:MAG: topoisomerase DNA-binding C4 zinc finger domain-containing protein [Candidatus Roizmanbacteria bacterium]